MRIEAAEHRLYWKIMAVGFFVDFIGAAILTVAFRKMTGEHDNTLFLAIGYVWLILQLFRFIITLLNIARLWIAKELGAFKSSGEAFFEALRHGDLPRPEERVYSVDAYLSNIVDDEDEPPKSRTVAACLYGIRQGTKNLGIWHSVFLDSAHEDALRRHAHS